VKSEKTRSNSKNLNLEDIARKAGVSRSTVSRVINNETYVSPRTRERVMAVVEKEGFAPNPAARSLVTRRTRIIGVVIPTSIQVMFEDSAYFPALLQGVVDVTNARDYATLLWWGSSEADEQTLYSRIMQQNQLMDGLILASIRTNDSLITRLMRMKVPFVTVERPTQFESKISYVTVDNVQAATHAVKYLVKLGRRRIATITGSLNNPDGYDRLIGYRQALREAGLYLDETMEIDGEFRYQTAYTVMKELLPKQPDAIFAGSDMMALGAMKAIQEAGLRVPEDIAVIGFDDVPLAAQSDPALTTVNLPVHERGYVAAAMLLDMIEGKNTEVRQVLLPTELIVRESCGTHLQPVAK